MYILSNGSRRFVTWPKYEYKFVGVSVTSCGECDATFQIRNIFGQHFCLDPDTNLIKCNNKCGQCDAIFKIRNILGSHMMLEHMTDIYLNV